MNVYADLVRLPAVLSAPGDALLGAAASPRTSAQTISAAMSSGLAYMAGMALNDYADRTVDAVERPHRPIPSGRISARRSLAVGTGLLAADLAVAWLGSGRRGVTYSAATGTAVLLYDFVAKDTAAGPWAMAACRFLDVQRGSGSFRAGLWPAGVMAAHTYMITQVSRSEVKGADPRLGRVSAAATVLIAAGAVASTPFAMGQFGATRSAKLRRGPQMSRLPLARSSFAVSALAAGIYAVPSVRASLRAVADPSPSNLQRVVRTGVMGMIPLQSSLTAAAGRPATGVGLLALGRAGRVLAAGRRVT